MNEVLDKDDLKFYELSIFITPLEGLKTVISPLDIEFLTPPGMKI